MLYLSNAPLNFNTSLLFRIQNIKKKKKKNTTTICICTFFFKMVVRKIPLAISPASLLSLKNCKKYIQNHVTCLSYHTQTKQTKIRSNKQKSNTSDPTLAHSIHSNNTICQQQRGHRPSQLGLYRLNDWHSLSKSIILPHFYVSYDSSSQPVSKCQSWQAEKLLLKYCYLQTLVWWGML